MKHILASSGYHYSHFIFFLFLSHPAFCFLPSSFYSLDSRIIDFKCVWVLHACIFHFSAFILKLKYMRHLKWERWFTDFGIRTERSSTLHLSWHNEPKGYKTSRWVDCLLVLKPHGNQLLRKHLNLKNMSGFVLLVCISSSESLCFRLHEFLL